MAAPAVTPELEAAAERAESRRGFLLAVPGWVYLIIFFAIPLAIVVLYSFASRSATGQTLLQDWNLDSYQRLASSLVVEVVFRSLWLAAATTIICLLLGYPFAYYIATRGTTMRNVLLVLVLIPFWSNFLVRTYAWRVLLGSEGPISQLTKLLGLGRHGCCSPPLRSWWVASNGFPPFMGLPLYAAIERIDWSLVEAGR